MDQRLKQLSYSSLLTLHACPRRYELYKLNSVESNPEDEDETASITFATGHSVGAGVAHVFLGTTEDEILWNLFLGWNADLLANDTKRFKSFWYSVIAIQKLAAMRREGFLKDWEVVEYNGKPAIELSFIISFPDGFVYRGFVDCVLRNKTNGKIMVLECKTSSYYELSAALYKNSAQAIGYSVVLDSLFPNLNTYEVFYLIYRTKHMVWEPMQFTKSYLQRALWIQELLLDIETLKLYDKANVYPMRGESCKSFGRDCEYFGVCTMSNTYLTKPMTPETSLEIDNNNSTFQIHVSISDLINAQLNKETVK